MLDAAWTRGTSGADTLVGTGRADRFDGLGGDDVLTGGAGADTFVIRANSGADRITDFKANGAGKVEFRDGVLIDFADLTAHSAQNGSDVLITLATGSLTLQGVQLSSLQASDFAFLT